MRWLFNYHTRLDFLGEELESRALAWGVEKSYIVYAHDHRNTQYHGAKAGTPQQNVLLIARRAAFWVFGILFDIADVEAAVKDAVEDSFRRLYRCRTKNLTLQLMKQLAPS